VRVEFTPDPTLYPFESRWFESSAGRMHYVDEGSGPTLLLCHGNPTWSFLYRHIISELRGSFRCVAADYLGFGLSDRPEGYGYSIAEHTRTFGELVDHLELDDYVLMGQDWGGPIGTGVSVERAERVRGIVLGNTWFWPSTSTFRFFSAIMSSRPMQRRILERNFFVERLMPTAMSRNLSEAEMDHYRRAQPSPEARLGVARMPREIREAEPLLERLSRDVPATLGPKPALIVWGMKDFGFRPGAAIPRMREALPDNEVLELPGANHYIQEDAPAEIAAAISRRFG
jgi:haloalkane dehalogenase